MCSRHHYEGVWSYSPAKHQVERPWVRVLACRNQGGGRTAFSVDITFKDGLPRMPASRCLGVSGFMFRACAGFGFTLPGSPSWRETSQHPQSRPSPNWAMGGQNFD